MRVALALAAGLLAGTVLGQGAPTAWAAFHEQAVSSASLRADVLAPPTGAALSASYCIVGSHAVDVGWTASASDWLDGYEVLLSTSPEGPFSAVPAGSEDPRATARTLIGLERKTTYYVVVASVRSTWRAGSAAVSVTTPSRTCA